VAGRGAGISTFLLAAAVAAAFADSSIVVLALPDLYRAFDTSIVGVSWVVTSYNMAVVAAAVFFLPLASRLEPGATARAGIMLFAFASLGCAAAWRLEALVGFRALQGLGGALLLGASLPLFDRLRLPSGRGAGAALWTAAGMAGAAWGPALGGVLTQLADWRAIFVAQAPVALAALARMPGSAPAGQAVRRSIGHVRSRYKDRKEGEGEGRLSRLAPGVGLALLFASLVGALFLSVLLLVTVWSLPPIEGALVVSALPVFALAAGRLTPALSPRQAAAQGAALVALGLAALALLPGPSEGLAVAALALCGSGLGLAVPVLGQGALAGLGSLRAGLVGVGVRHLGLVLALALVAPVLSQALDRDGRRALLAGTRVVLDGNVPLATKVPIALDLRDALAQAKEGEIPDLSRPFDARGARVDARLAQLRDELVTTLEGVLTRSFRGVFTLCALFALLASLAALRLREAPP